MSLRRAACSRACMRASDTSPANAESSRSSWSENASVFGLCTVRTPSRSPRAMSGTHISDRHEGDAAMYRGSLDTSPTLRIVRDRAQAPVRPRSADIR